MNENETDFMLTTFDNSFNPFTDYEAWWKEDLRLGHDCNGLIARIANTSDLASDEVNEAEIARAIDEIVESEPMIYRKVTKADYKST